MERWSFETMSLDEAFEREYERRAIATRARTRAPARPRPRPAAGAVPRPWPRPRPGSFGAWGVIDVTPPAAPRCGCAPADDAAPLDDADAADEFGSFETLELEAPPVRPTLRRGSRGADVVELQRRLAAAGADPGAVDGIFGSLTDAAVRTFQRLRGLGVDGIVGAQTWAALLGGGSSVPPAPSPPAAPGNDLAIEALKLAEPARSAAYAVKQRHPWVVFTSGRRDVADQARAMAGNVVQNRRWIAETYASSPVSRAAQAWVDAHPEAQSSDAIAAGLLSVFQGFSAAEMGRLSYHLSGLAFDIQPVLNRLSEIVPTIQALPRLKEFLTKEGGLDRWHVALM
jgi:peptidoglycan hydrolase-like protein with peptidoglycan-binding domain